MRRNRRAHAFRLLHGHVPELERRVGDGHGDRSNLCEELHPLKHQLRGRVSVHFFVMKAFRTWATSTSESMHAGGWYLAAPTREAAATVARRRRRREEAREAATGLGGGDGGGAMVLAPSSQGGRGDGGGGRRSAAEMAAEETAASAASAARRVHQGAATRRGRRREPRPRVPAVGQSHGVQGGPWCRACATAVDPTTAAQTLEVNLGANVEHLPDHSSLRRRWFAAISSP